MSVDETTQDVESSDLNKEEGRIDDDGDQMDDGDSNRSSVDEFAEFSWLEQIDTVATRYSTEIATCDAKLIRRDQISSAFWIQMEEPSHETSCLGFDLFDRYGRLNREFYEHSFKKGSGAWGSELDRGDILLFEKISVTPQHRRDGLGTQIVQAILEKIRPKTNRFVAFVSPGYLTDEVDEGGKGEWREHQAISELFFRSLGFRRVGVSSWFAFVDNPSHPSRQLKASDDWNEPDNSYDTACIPQSARQAFASLSNPKLPGGECVSQLQKDMPADFQDASWSAVDEDGNNILHLAAIHAKLEAIQYILSCRRDLASNRNRAGDSPLEALKAKMESIRTRAVHGELTSVCADKFAGFSQRIIACIAALSDSEIFNLDEISPDLINEISSAAEEIKRNPKIQLALHSLRLRYGCTCGECIGGFLSPRMRFALLCQAEIQHDLMRESFYEFQDGPDWVGDNDEELNFLPASVKENLKTNKSMREGFINICGYIAECLKQRRIPNENNVLYIYQKKSSEWPPVTKHYLERGGTVAAVATMLFQKALQQGEYSGDGNHQVVFGDEIVKMPECRNDYEFGFVSGMCGYRTISAVQYVDMFGNPIDKD
jgi:GNAT superfamily N-acetyltransferase